MFWIELLWIIFYKNWIVYGFLNNDDVRKVMIFFIFFLVEYLEFYFSDIYRYRLNIENGLDVLIRNN